MIESNDVIAIIRESIQINWQYIINLYNSYDCKIADFYKVHNIL